MEFLRFGSKIPGSSIGCCACDIIQGFNSDPDAKSSIQLTSGDGGGALTKAGQQMFLGPTNKDIFLNRLRVDTFGLADHPNHAFLAIIAAKQMAYGHGKAWMQILKEAGFEFIRAFENSVYSGGSTNYLFGLFRNVGPRAVSDPFAPPKEWTDLPEQTKSQKQIWDEGKTVLLTEEELIKAGAPVMMAGVRSKYPPQPKSQRELMLAEENKRKGIVAKPNPFGQARDHLGMKV